MKTTRVKEEEKQRNMLGNVLHPAVNTKSQTVLKYRRAFGEIVDMPGNQSFDSSRISAGNFEDSRSIDSNEISMYNTDNDNVKHIYTTKSLIINRFKNSPYVNSSSPSKRFKMQMEKPWRKNMASPNANAHFVE